jgi:hypothetical protein
MVSGEAWANREALLVRQGLLKGMGLPARSAPVWIAVVAGLWAFGCARTVLPPPASISPPLPAPTPVSPNLGSDVPQPLSVPSLGAPVSSTNPWKPSVPARKWKYIVLHHTASDEDSVESIHDVHVQKKDKKGNPWLGIGYHFVIGNGQGMTDGEIEPTFRWKTQIQGAHAGSADRDYNEIGIGICLVGNYEKYPPSPRQVTAVKRLLRVLKGEYKIVTGNIVKHSDVRDGGTECPGKHFPMAEVIAAGDRNLVEATAVEPVQTALRLRPEKGTVPFGR